MSIRETEPTALPEDAEPETQPTPDFFIHQTPPPTPTPAPEPQAAADTDSETETETETYDELESEVDPESEIDDEADAYDDPESETVETESEVDDELEIDDEIDADDESESETVEAESEVDDEIAAYDEPEPETAESEVDDEIDAYGEPESETAETESEVDDEATVEVESDVDSSDDVEPQAVTDGLPGHNGDGPAEAEAEPEGPHEVVVGGRPYLRDGGVFEERWTAIQTGFVDDPRLAVESADHLITEAIDDLATILAGHRETLQAQWRDDVDTEQLRVVFRDYRAYLLGLLHT